MKRLIVAYKTHHAILIQQRVPKQRKKNWDSIFQTFKKTQLSKLKKSGALAWINIKYNKEGQRPQQEERPWSQKHLPTLMTQTSLWEAQTRSTLDTSSNRPWARSGTGIASRILCVLSLKCCPATRLQVYACSEVLVPPVIWCPVVEKTLEPILWQWRYPRTSRPSTEGVSSSPKM